MSVSKIEVETACAALRWDKYDAAHAKPDRHYLAAMLEALQATIERLEQSAAVERNELSGVIERKSALIAKLVEAGLAASAEIVTLRDVVRCADYFIVAGQDSRYDEARVALTKFDTVKR